MEHPRYGYRRLPVLLRRSREQNREKRTEFNVKRIHRLYKEEGPSLRRRGAKAGAARRSAAGTAHRTQPGVGAGLRA